MPRISDDFLDCSVYLYLNEADAELGRQFGASGFLVGMPLDKNSWLLPGPCLENSFHHLYAVANRHSILDGNSVVRLNRDDGTTSIINVSPNAWFCSSEHDIAVLPIDWAHYYKYLAVSTKSLLTQDAALAEDIGIGDEVFMVGRFINHDGRQRNHPSIRFGHISMMPSDEPVKHKSNLSGGQTSFLVEVHSIPGYSGSPVFVRPFPTQKLTTGAKSAAGTIPVSYASTPPPPMYTLTPPVTARRDGPWLLGIEWGVLHLTREKDTPKEHFTGMSGVVPAWYLSQLLCDDERLILQRREEQQRFIDGITNTGTTLT